MKLAPGDLRRRLEGEGVLVVVTGAVTPVSEWVCECMWVLPRAETGMASVETRRHTRTPTMASSPPPALAGFGVSGKSFLIDHLLQKATVAEGGSTSTSSSSSSSSSSKSGSSSSSSGGAGGRLGHALCRSPRRSWGPQHCVQLQHQAPGWPLQQVKDLGRPLLTHPGKASGWITCFKDIMCLQCIHACSCPYYTLELVELLTQHKQNFYIIILFILYIFYM